MWLRCTLTKVQKVGRVARSLIIYVNLSAQPSLGSILPYSALYISPYFLLEVTRGGTR
jgi:hypothetical protein